MDAVKLLDVIAGVEDKMTDDKKRAALDAVKHAMAITTYGLDGMSMRGQVLFNHLHTIEAALTTPPSCGWQDISTAPKDGTQILSAVKNKYGWHVQTCVWQNLPNFGFWWWAGKDNWCPTHWKPIGDLPPAPKGKDDE